ncbi:diguanylate cyclase [Guptibacillus spartinae]|uniref:diguanylate cyclase n=1 Tax=Guptibacillus spartinae TaxID=3025679 RepID=UPI00235E0E86|nr:diguanylate cyclase [Pseudalkalibacillus spartinae]
MEKYKKKFLSNMEEKYEEIKTRNDTVTEKELYQLLHTFKGTAGTVGYTKAAEKAEALLNQFEFESERYYSGEETIRILDNVMDGIREEGPEASNKEVDAPKMIMIINSNPLYLIEMKENLERTGYIVFAAMDLSKARAALYDMYPDCIIIEFQLIERDESGVAREVREKAELQFIPLILTSTERKDSNRMKAYEFGADDFLDLDVEKEEYLLRVNRKIEKRKMIVHSVLTDELTGAYNRKFLDSQLNYMRYDLVRNGENASLIIFDIDHFKSVNDKYGHLMGDQVLKSLAQFIIEEKRNTDTFIRYGGEEFVLILPDTNSNQAARFLERLLEGFKKKVFRTNNHSFSVTFSAGVVEIDASSSNQQLLNYADEALYRAKANGRDQVIVYQSDNGSSKRLKSIRIAIVDDDEIMRNLLTSKLSDFSIDGNYDIEVKSYEEGYSFFEDTWHKTGAPCLVLLDGIMPGMDGNEVLSKLREEQDSSDYAVMMLTGRKAEKDIIQSLELGADDYITKPFRIEELEARINKLIQKIL